MTVTCEQVTGKYKVVIPSLLLETFLLPFQFTLADAQTVYPVSSTRET